MYTASKRYQQRGVPTGLRFETWQPDMDVQLWAIGTMCPVAAGRPHPDHSRSVRVLIPSLSPWSHTCLSATCLPLPLISTQSAFCSCLVSSRRVQKHQQQRESWHSSVVQLSDVLSWCCMSLTMCEKKIPSDRTAIPSDLTRVFLAVSLQTAWAPKPPPFYLSLSLAVPIIQRRESRDSDSLSAT